MKVGQPLSLALREAIEPALARLRAGSGEGCLSDLTFSNLWLFREAHDYRYIEPEDDGWPRISGRTYDGTRHLVPLFALPQAPPEALATMLEDHDCFYPLSRRDIEGLSADRFALSASPDDADYLYDASRFADYAGRALAWKRSQVRQLLAQCTPRAEAFGPASAGAALRVLEAWMAQKGKAAGEADEAPCRAAIADAAALGLEGFVHFAHDEPLGFVLAQELQPGVFAMRFAKGLDSHAGIYPHMFQHFCQQFEAGFGRPVRWLNFEQDMGIAGFRRSKRSYAPAAMVQKFRARLLR